MHGGRGGPWLTAGGAASVGGGQRTVRNGGGPGVCGDSRDVPSAVRERPGRGAHFVLALMLAGLASALVWALDFREMALDSRFDPDCPATGCYASFGPVGAPIVAGLGLLVGCMLTPSVLRTWRDNRVRWLLGVVMLQWTLVVVVGVVRSSTDPHSVELSPPRPGCREHRVIPRWAVATAYR